MQCYVGVLLLIGCFWCCGVFLCLCVVSVFVVGLFFCVGWGVCL